MLTVLIVDDDPSDREGIIDFVDWAKLDLQVVGSAVDGREGYAKALALRPDLILTDIAMPLVDGLQMADSIRKQLPETKFIFMSCFDDFSYAQEALNLHAYAYVLKPIHFSELNAALTRTRAVRQGELEQRQALLGLQRQLEQSKPVLREQFFTDLLHGRLQSSGEIEQYMRYLEIDYAHKSYVILFVQIDNYALLYPEVPVEQRFLVIYSMKQQAEDLLLPGGSGHAMIRQPNSLAVILAHDREPDDREDPYHLLLEVLDEYKATVNRTLNVNITIGISEFGDRLQDAPQLLEKAEYAVKSKFYSSGNRVILASDVKSADAPLQYDLQCLRNELHTILEQGTAEELAACLDRYYQSPAASSEIYIKTLSYSILTIVQALLMEKNESMEHILAHEQLLWEQLAKFETALDIRQWLLDILEAVRSHLSRLGNTRYKKIVEEIKGIIEARYAELNIIEEIVKPLYISASHANAVFKQQTGKTIFDYLFIKRMEAAKGMLRDSPYKIYEIAEKVGYKDKSYFSSTFKAYTGLTPKQYANNNTL